MTPDRLAELDKHHEVLLRHEIDDIQIELVDDEDGDHVDEWLDANYAACNALPELIAEVRRLQAENERLQKLEADLPHYQRIDEWWMAAKAKLDAVRVLCDQHWVSLDGTDFAEGAWVSVADVESILDGETEGGS